MALMSGPRRDRPTRDPSGPGATLVAEFADRWRRGESPRAEEYLARPPATADATVALALIYQEYCLAASSGLQPDPGDYLLRFPDHRDRLVPLLAPAPAPAADEEDDGAADPGDEGGGGGAAELPEVGDEVGPYRLVRALGRGTFARVFLAEQADLEGRLVVVKVANRATTEPWLLARAPHAHIVEILRHAETPDGLQVICLPFLGGATLADVLAAGRRRAGRPRVGGDLLADLDRVAAPEYPRAALDRPAREVLAGLTYAQAVAWMVARLAEALDHAYRRGVAHGDVKPSNVLLTADGQPMLFDFNLAVDCPAESADPTATAAELGGTLAYMAPERLRALADPAAAREARPIDRHRADLYALGLVLRQVLVDALPGVPESLAATTGPRALAAELARRRAPQGDESRRHRDRLPPGLRPIIARCLAPDPADRYGRSAELAADLDLWRANRRPAYAAPPPIWVELGRWARRRRRPLIAGAACLLAGLIAAGIVANRYQTSQRDQAIEKLGRLWDGDLGGEWSRPGTGRNGYDAGDPAELARRRLAQYDALGPADWSERADVQALPEAERADLELWIAEQSYRYGLGLMTPNAPQPTATELEGLGRLASRFRSGPLSRIIDALPSRTGRTRARSTDRRPPEPAVDAYLRGLQAEILPVDLADDLRVSVDALGSVVAADSYLDATAAQPGSFWATFRGAVVAERLSATDEASRLLERGLSMRPDHAPSLALLARNLARQGRADEAAAAADRALAIAPNSEAALWQRLMHDRGKPTNASGLTRSFSALTRSRGMHPAGKLMLGAMVASGEFKMLGPAEREAALRSLLALEPDDAEARTRLADHLRFTGRPDEAAVEATRAIEAAPEYLQARRTRAQIVRGMETRTTAGADELALVDHPRFDQLVGRDPSALYLLRITVAEHLRRGDRVAASRLADKGLAIAERLGNMRGAAHYVAAMAEAAAAEAEPERLDQAARHLRAAAAEHAVYLNDYFVGEAAFDPVRPQLLTRLSRPLPR